MIKKHVFFRNTETGKTMNLSESGKSRVWESDAPDDELVAEIPKDAEGATFLLGKAWHETSVGKFDRDRAARAPFAFFEEKVTDELKAAVNLVSRDFMAKGYRSRNGLPEIPALNIDVMMAAAKKAKALFNALAARPIVAEKIFEAAKDEAVEDVETATVDKTEATADAATIEETEATAEAVTIEETEATDDAAMTKAEVAETTSHEQASTPKASAKPVKGFAPELKGRRFAVKSDRLKVDAVIEFTGRAHGSSRIETAVKDGSVIRCYSGTANSTLRVANEALARCAKDGSLVDKTVVKDVVFENVSAAIAFCCGYVFTFDKYPTLNGELENLKETKEAFLKGELKPLDVVETSNAEAVNAEADEALVEDAKPEAVEKSVEDAKPEAVEESVEDVKSETVEAPAAKTPETEAVAKAKRTVKYAFSDALAGREFVVGSGKRFFLTGYASKAQKRPIAQCKIRKGTKCAKNVCKSRVHDECVRIIEERFVDGVAKEDFVVDNPTIAATLLHGSCFGFTAVSAVGQPGFENLKQVLEAYAAGELTTPASPVPAIVNAEANVLIVETRAKEPAKLMVSKIKAPGKNGQVYEPQPCWVAVTNCNPDGSLSGSLVQSSGGQAHTVSGVIAIPIAGRPSCYELTSTKEGKRLVYSIVSGEFELEKQPSCNYGNANYVAHTNRFATEGYSWELIVA